MLIMVVHCIKKSLFVVVEQDKPPREIPMKYSDFATVLLHDIAIILQLH